MENKSKTDDQKSKGNGIWIKILIPALIVIVVAGIFIFKNTPQEEASHFNSSEFDLDATNDFDLEALFSYGLPVFIDFGADSCLPCKEMAPVLKELNEELRGKAIVKFVDVWKNADAAQAVPLRVIPTQFFFDKDGKPYLPSDVENSSFVMYGNQETNEVYFTAHEGGMTKEEILAVLKEMGVE